MDITKSVYYIIIALRDFLGPAEILTLVTSVSNMDKATAPTITPLGNTWKSV